MKKIQGVDYFQNELCIYCKSCADGLSPFIQYHGLAEHSWNEACSDHLRTVEKKIDGAAAADHFEIRDSYAEDSILYEEAFPQLHRYSLFVTLHNYLEKCVSDLCGILEGCIECKIKPKHLNSKGLERSRTYLEKVAEFDFSTMNVEWENIRKLSMVRNHIVHNSGEIDGTEDKKLLHFMKETDGKITEGDGALYLSPDAIDFSIKIIKEFLAKLGKEVEKFIEKE